MLHVKLLSSQSPSISSKQSTLPDAAIANAHDSRHIACASLGRLYKLRHASNSHRTFDASAPPLQIYRLRKPPKSPQTDPPAFQGTNSEDIVRIGGVQLARVDLAVFIDLDTFVA